LGGVGSLATKWVLIHNISLTNDLMIVGVRTLEIKENISISCEVVGYNLAIL
jgi:hypothetical protein